MSEEKSDVQWLEAAGTFPIVVVAPGRGWLGEVGDDNTPFVRIPCQVASGPHEGKMIVWKGWLTEKAIEKTVEALVECFGWNGDMEALQNDTVDFEGKEARLVVEKSDRETKDGNPIYDARWLNPAGAGKMDDDAAGSLIARLGAQTKALAKGAAKGRPAPSSAPPSSDPPAGAADDDDDIPF